MKKVEVHNGQCLQDVTIREMGGLEGIFDFAMLNGFSITENLSQKKEILTPNRTISASIVRYYKNKNVQPSTAITTAGGYTQKLFQNGLFENGLFE